MGIVDDAEDGARASGTHARATTPPNTDDVGFIEQALKRVSLFEALHPPHLERIASIARQMHVERGQTVFAHGDQGDGLFVILRGAVRISRTMAGGGEEALAILKEGMHFGEMSIVEDDAPRSADAVANENTSLLKIGKDDLRDLMFVDRELAYDVLWRFVRTLGARLRESNDRLLMLTLSARF